MTVKKFEDLEVWKEARSLSKVIFRLTKREPFINDFKLKNQMKGSSGSTMDNIAEGFERDGNKEFTQFLSIAKVLVEKHVLNPIEHLIMNTSLKKS